MKKILTIGLTAFLSIGIVTALYLTNNPTNVERNEFTRSFKDTLRASANVNLGFNSYYIAGTAENTLYFGNSTAPLHLLAYDDLQKDTVHIQLGLDKIETIPVRSLHLSVDSPAFYLKDGTVPMISRGLLSSKIAKRFMYDSVFFTQSVQIGRYSFAMRTYFANHKTYALVKEFNHPPYRIIVPNSLKRQVDGILDIDGMLHYNKVLNRVVYLYYYRNEFMCLDSNLNALHSGRTIDPLSKATIRVSEIKSENTVTFAAPPVVVNKRSCTNGVYLYILSPRLSKTESIDAFRKSSVIDVYNLTTGSYEFSFYVPDQDSEKVNDFTVLNRKFFALQGTQLFVYDFL